MAGKALIMIDMLNEFVKGRLSSPFAQNIVPQIKKVLESARKNDALVVFARDCHRKGDKEFEIWGEHALCDSPDSQIIEELAPDTKREKEFVVPKRRYDAFWMTDLDLLLREFEIKEVVLTGISTDICVLHTAMGAFFRNYRVSIVEDGVAAFTEEDHRWALNYMKKAYGASLISSEEASTDDFWK